MPKTHDVYVIKATRPPAKYAEYESFEDALIKGDGLLLQDLFLGEGQSYPIGCIGGNCSTWLSQLTKRGCDCSMHLWKHFSHILHFMSTYPSCVEGIGSDIYSLLGNPSPSYSRCFGGALYRWNFNFD